MNDKPKIIAIIEAGLRVGGYDGLCNAECGCACLIGDLFPCHNAENLDCCTPGVKMEGTWGTAIQSEESGAWLIETSEGK
jgi:hypothetical protein